jgi:putative redox protein
MRHREWPGERRAASPDRQEHDMADKSATVTHLSRLTFDVEMGGHHILMDTKPPGGDGRGPSPMDLLLASLAGCTAFDIVSILEKSRQPLAGLSVRADGYRAEDHPRRYTRIVLTYTVHGDVDERALRRAVELSEEKYCSVSATLRQGAEIETRIVRGDAEPAPAPGAAADSPEG